MASTPGSRKVVVDIIGDAKGYKKATDDAVKASTGFSGKMEALDRKLTAIGKRGGVTGALLGGAGVGIGLGAFGLIERGITSVVGALGGAVQAAIEDERATAKLTQTIQANVKAWDGSLDAVNAAIDAGAQLAFTDDEVRDGLNQLLPRTKDVAEAIKLNALAMDLARAKGMGLEEAATLVGKAYSGQASALRRAGIAIKDTKNSTAALAELQRSVNGQAKTYANTTEGAMKRMDIQTSEALESIGYAIKPVVGAFIGFAADVIPEIITGIGNLGDAFDDLHGFIDPNYGSIRELEKAIRAKAAAQGVDAEAVIAWKKATDAATAAAQQKARQDLLNEDQIQSILFATRQSMAQMISDQDELNKYMDDYEAKLRAGKQATDALTTSTTGLDSANGQALDTIDAYWNAVDDVIAKWEEFGDSVAYGTKAWSDQNNLMRDNADLLRGAFADLPPDLQKALVAAGIVVREGSADLAVDDGPAKRSIKSIVHAYSGGVLDIAEAIEAGSGRIIEDFRNLAWQSKHPFAVTNYEDWLRARARAAMRKMEKANEDGRPDLVAQYSTLYTEIVAELEGLPGYAETITKRILAALDPAVQMGFTWADPGTWAPDGNPKVPKPKKKGGKGKRPGHKASGGRVSAGDAEFVGELGRELFVPEQDGTIIPAGALDRMGRGGGTTVVNNFIVHVHAPVGADLSRAGQQVVTAIQAYQRNGGAAHVKRAVNG